jgi:hypothetical protein
MSHKQTYRVITSRKQDGSLAATSEVSEDMFKWVAVNHASEMLRQADVYEVTIKKNNYAFPADTEI